MANFFPLNSLLVLLTIKVKVAMATGKHVTDIGRGGNDNFIATALNANILEEINDTLAFGASTVPTNNTEDDLTFTHNSNPGGTGELVATLLFIDFTDFVPVDV